MKYLHLIRYKNLLLLALVQLVFRYGFLRINEVPLALNDFNYSLLILATVLIAAGGYIINDIFDIETDAINKPDRQFINNTIPESTAYNIYFGVTVTGVGIGFYLSNIINKPSFATLFILTAALLYFYSSTLKQIVLVGNIAIALLSGLSVLIIAAFDLYPVTQPENQKQMSLYFSILLDYAKFAFVANFIREIVKDLEDYQGDLETEIKTLPVVVGIKITKYIALLFTVALSIYLLLYCNNYLMKNNLFYALFYMLALVIAPLVVTAFMLFTTKDKKGFGNISTILKLVLFFGILSVWIITLNIKYNA